MEDFIQGEHKNAYDRATKMYWKEALKLYRNLEHTEEVDREISYRRECFIKCGLPPEPTGFLEILRIASGMSVWEN